MAENILAQQVRAAIDSENLAAFIKENLQGKNLSIKGLAALCGVSHTSIIRGGAFGSTKLGETLSSKGFQAAALAENGFNPVATWLTIEHFAYDSKAKAEYAKAIARTFGAFGIKSAFNEISGQPSSHQPLLPPEDRIPGFVTAGQALGQMFGDAYGESFTLMNIKKLCPSLALPEPPAKERASLASPEILLTPTQIASQLGLTYKTSGNPSPRAANLLLESNGLQERIGGGWSPTEKGKAFSERKPVLTKGKTDRDQLFWYSSVLSEIGGTPQEAA